MKPFSPLKKPTCIGGATAETCRETLDAGRGLCDLLEVTPEAQAYLRQEAKAKRIVRRFSSFDFCRPAFFIVRPDTLAAKVYPETRNG